MTMCRYDPFGAEGVRYPSPVTLDVRHERDVGREPVKIRSESDIIWDGCYCRRESAKTQKDRLLT